MNDDTQETDGAQAEASGAQAIAQDLETLRRLAARLHRLAPMADEHVLRVILGKREALLDSIRTRLAQAPAPAEPDVSKPAASEIGEPEQRQFARTLAEITALDRESEGLLKKRSGDTAAEIQKLRAGRHWRESSQRWT